MAKLSQVKLGSTIYDIGAAWENISGKPSSFPPSSHEHNYIKYKDTRALNESPDDVQAGLTVHLKSNGTDSISDGGSYHAVLNVKDWGDYSGGPYWQSTVTANNNMYFRRSTAGTTWGSWQKVLSDNNYTDYTVTKTGTGATGTWGINISGNAATATKLATTKTIQTNLTSTSTASFDGTANVTPGVTGILGIGNGGTGKTTKNAAYTNLLHQGNLSDATLNLKRGLYTYSTSAANVPGSYGCVYNVIANNIDEGVAIGGTTSSSWVWQVAFDTSQTAPYIRNSVNAGAFNTWRRFWIQGDAVTGAVWNDYAECRETDCEEFGYVLMEVGDDSLTKTTERLSHFAGVSSDTWGFSQGETARARTPIAVAGRVLVYPYQDRNNYKPGDCVCAAPGGTVDIMTREEVREWSDRIVGTVSCVPDYEEWGGGEGADRDPVKVDGRIWIKVK